MRARIAKTTTPAIRPAFRHDSVSRVTTVLLPILLNARGAQAGEPVLIDRILPGQKFLDGQCVAAASLFERKQAAAHGRHHLGLAPDDPTLGARGGQISDGQRTTVRSDDILGPRSKGLAHESTQLTRLTNSARNYSAPL